MKKRKSRTRPGTIVRVRIAVSSHRPVPSQEGNYPHNLLTPPPPPPLSLPPHSSRGSTCVCVCVRRWTWQIDGRARVECLKNPWLDVVAAAARSGNFGAQKVRMETLGCHARDPGARSSPHTTIHQHVHLFVHRQFVWLGSSCTEQKL